jgi:3-hydroxyacyl-[acyl-carrier-protein] dehydratase
MNAQHGLYKVHFPGNPVTPGVCLVQMATEILERKYDKKFQLSEAVNIKFRKTVGPDDEPTFVINKAVFEDDQLKTSVTFEDSEDQYVKMSLIYKVSD